VCLSVCTGIHNRQHAAHTRSTGERALQQQQQQQQHGLRGGGRLSARRSHSLIHVKGVISTEGPKPLATRTANHGGHGLRRGQRGQCPVLGHWLLGRPPGGIPGASSSSSCAGRRPRRPAAPRVAAPAG